MVRTAEWTVSQGGDKRTFIVHYLDDPLERSAAIEYINALGGVLHSICPVTEELWAMSVPDANEHFAANPMQQTYDALFLRGRCDEVTDDALVRLPYIPELQEFHVHSNLISDVGVRHIASSLTHLEVLVLYSPLITDACLEVIAEMTNLRTLDLQGSPQVTTAAFDALLGRLPNIVDSYGPHH